MPRPRCRESGRRAGPRLRPETPTRWRAAARGTPPRAATLPRAARRPRRPSGLRGAAPSRAAPPAPAGAQTARPAPARARGIGDRGDGGAPDQPALHRAPHPRRGGGLPPFRDHRGRQQAEPDHEQVVQERYEEQQRPPRRPARVRRTPHRHAEPDPQERQRPQRQPEHHAGGHTAQRALLQQRYRIEIVGGAPQPAGVGPDDRGVHGVLEQQQGGAASDVRAPVHALRESEPQAQIARQDAFASSSSFFRASTSLCATSGGTSWYTWNFWRYVPRPWVSECSTVAYLSSSASGTWVFTLVRRPSFSVPRICPRRDDRSPITAP